MIHAFICCLLSGSLSCPHYRDLKEYQKRPPPGIVIVPRSEQLSLMDVLIIGPKDTPYEGGLFHFVLRFPPNYPLAPPRARLMTTSGNSVRFNPNFYKSGKVCLSLLG
jgi:ubiquitin-conjugating enzyme E2 Z